MKTISFFAFTILASCLTVNAQVFDWVKTFGNLGSDGSMAVSADAIGNVYTTGWFNGNVDFDHSNNVSILQSNGGQDIFVQKTDALGNFVWAKAIGGYGEDIGNDILVDNVGNIYVVGRFLGDVDFDPSQTTNINSSKGDYDIFIQKLDSLGNLIWVKTFGGYSTDNGTGLASDKFGNIYISGYFNETVDFDPGPNYYYSTSNGWTDGFILKIDPNGNFVWVQSFGGTLWDESYVIDIDTIGNIYAGGLFEGTSVFGTENLHSNGNKDVFIHKLDSNGNFIWAKSFGGVNSDNIESLEIDIDGNVMSTGYFLGTIDFNPSNQYYGLSSTANSDVYLQKLDSSGNFIWAKSFGGNLWDESYDIQTDTTGNIYLSGVFQGEVDFDPGPNIAELSSLNQRDLFILKLDMLGNLIWVRSCGGAGNEVSHSICLDQFENLYITGWFGSSTDFDPSSIIQTSASLGDYDGFILKLNSCQIIEVTQNITTCDSYTWIDGINYDSTTNVPIYRNVNSFGCDSITKLNLTILKSSTTFDTINANNYYTWIDGNTYNTSNTTATYTLTNSSGCDSTIKLYLTINTISDNSTSLIGNTIYANNLSATYQWLDCDNNFSILVGETNQSFVPIKSGNYSVQLTENEIVDTSDCVNFETLSVDKFDNNINLVNVYPNPTNDIFNLEFNQTIEYIELTLFDAYGKKIFNQNCENVNNKTLKLVNEKGIYFLTIKTSTEIITIKLIKN